MILHGQSDGTTYMYVYVFFLSSVPHLPMKYCTVISRIQAASIQTTLLFVLFHSYVSAFRLPVSNYTTVHTLPPLPQSLPHGGHVHIANLPYSTHILPQY